MEPIAAPAQTLRSTEDVAAKLALVNVLLWSEIRRVPELNRKIEENPEFHLLTGAILPSVECCTLEFRLSRDESADLTPDGIPITYNHFLRMTDDGYKMIINAIESIGLFDVTEPIQLPLKVGGIEAYDSPRQDHY